jgi:hypothetical protein
MKAIAWLVGTVLIATLSFLPTPAHAFCTQGYSPLEYLPPQLLARFYLRLGCCHFG